MSIIKQPDMSADAQKYGELTREILRVAALIIAPIAAGKADCRR
ncbi:hypothetical protein [Nonomuraea sp. NEAU-A123]|nr:hypothetical protein [Nonomuraea sp. NEAU-A123]